ncbi:MAG TPA: hypothetical protein VFV89_00130 [Nocardioides sp.]|uniref:hypothetical protein n=1 Tax=Nocardioides sp. TaxID=35761 RepID=UPI002E338468|nr:hypothetical protein [Nocardioides sp.]HEX5086183.1 hypothetical protein [Nocardioides sp.]
MHAATTDLPALLDAVSALGRAARYDEALALLDATQPADEADRLALLMARAGVVGRRDYTRGVPSGADHPLDAATELARELGTGPTTSWDLAMLHLRRQYADQLVDGIGPAGRDQAVVAAMTVEATRLRDTAPDDGRRGWALMCLGWIADNLRGDRDHAPAHYEQALGLGRAVDDPVLVFEAQRHLGDHAHDDGDHAAALAAWQESATAAARGGHVLGVLAQQVLLAVLARDAGDEAGARALAAETLRWADAVGAARLAAQAADVLAGVDPTQPPPGSQG